MFLKAFSIFLSLGSVAILPLVLPKQEKLQDSLQIFNVAQRDENEPKSSQKRLSIDFFARYFENINKDIIACKAGKQTICPLFFYLEDKETKQQAILQVVRANTLKDAESEGSGGTRWSDAISQNPSDKSKDILDTLPEELKSKSAYLKEITYIKLFDNDKLTIGLSNGEVKTVMFYISEELQDLSNLKKYCAENNDKDKSLICRALATEADFPKDDKKVLYR